MIDQIKPKNLGADLNNNKVTSEPSSKKVSDAKVSKVSHPTTMLNLIMERFRSSFPKKR